MPLRIERSLRTSCAVALARAVTVLTAAALLLASCSPAADESGIWSSVESPGPDTITLAYALGDDAHRRGLHNVVNAFKKSHLNLQIEVADESPQAKGYADQLTLLDAMGAFPDLVEMRDTQMFADAGLLAELPQEFHTMFGPLPEVNGKVYTAPLKAETPQGIIYNKALFRELGLQEPGTYAEFLALCEQLRDSGVYPLVVGGQDLWHMGFWVNHFLVEHVYAADPEWNRKRAAGTVSWTDAGPTAALRALKGLWDADYVMPGFLSITDSRALQPLLAGEAAMLMSGPWVLEQLEEANPAFEAGFFPVPGQDGVIRILGLPEPSGWAISAAAAADPEKLKHIKQFLYFFYSDEMYPTYLEQVSGLPATAEAGPYQASPLVREIGALLQDPEVVKLRSMEHYWGEDRIPAGFRNVFYALIQEVLADQLSVEEALQRADEAWAR